MKIEMFGATGEAALASVMAAAALIGVAVGSAPSEALASSASDTQLAANAAIGSIRTFAMNGSAMEPSIPRGALTLAEVADPGSVRVGDIVTLQISGGLVTRRVVGSDAIDAGRLVTLKADQEQAPDGAGVLFTDRATVVRAYIPLVGYAAELIGEYGRAALGLAGIALLALVTAARWRLRRPISATPGIAPAPAV